MEEKQCILIYTENNFNFNIFKNIVLNSRIFKEYREYACMYGDDTEKEFNKFDNSINKLTYYNVNKNLLLIDNEYFIEFFAINSNSKFYPDEVFNNIKYITYIMFNKPKFITYRDLYKIFNIIKCNPSIYNYYNNRDHTLQYISEDIGLFTEYSYIFLEFNIKNYNKIIYNKIFDLYSDEIIKLKNNLKKYIIIDLSSIFPKEGSFMVIYSKE